MEHAESPGAMLMLEQFIRVILLWILYACVIFSPALLIMCGKKKEKSVQDPKKTNPYVSKTCNKQGELLPDDPDLKSEQLNQAGKVGADGGASGGATGQK